MMETIVCPHCSVTICVEAKSHYLGSESGEEFGYSYRSMTSNCPACERLIVAIEQVWQYNAQSDEEVQERFIAFPRTTRAWPVAEEVPQPYRQDFTEASAIVADSPKASAALSRRCLQTILHEHLSIRKKNLEMEIDELLASNGVPSHIADSLHAVRNIGNFAAHPLKSTNTGEIIEVEQGEAEWNLKVLEDLFDYYFVGPAKAKARKDALNKKLAEAGKPLIK